MHPYWGPGLARPLAKGAIIGFSSIHTRKHIYRSIVEGIAFELRQGLESIERSQRQKVKTMRISGGGSISDKICQFTADIFVLENSRIQTSESTSLGAAIATFSAIKQFDSVQDAVDKMVKTSKTFKPNALNHKRYNQIYHGVYKKVYPRLNPLNRQINKLFKR